MQIDRKKLLAHFEHISCGGMLKDAILTDRFRCRGFSVNQDLLVIAGDLDKADPLAGEIGVIGLDLLMKCLNAGDDDRISLDVDGPHIVLTTADRVIRLVTASPAVIASKADQHLVDKVLQAIPEGITWVPLNYRLVSGIADSISKLGAENVVFFVGPAGTKIVVGEEKVNSAQFTFPDLKAATEIKLVLHAKLLQAVFSMVKDYTKAEMCVTGENSIVPLREGPYTYIMSPAAEVAK